MKYDPALPPEPTQWLALDEGEQIALIEDYHRRAGIDLPQSGLHAAIHAVIEQQLASQLAPVASAFKRLQKEGLDRHDAVHALGAVLTEHMRQLMTGDPTTTTDPNAAYFAALDRLSATSWRREFGMDNHGV